MAITSCEKVMNKYSDYAASSPQDSSCPKSGTDLSNFGTTGTVISRSRMQRLTSYKHDQSDAENNPLPLDVDGQSKFPESCVPHEVLNSKNSSNMRSRLQCPVVCAAGQAWNNRMQGVMISTTWLTWLLFIGLVLILRYSEYTHNGTARGARVPFENTLQSVPKALQIRLMFPFVLNFFIIVPMLIKLSNLFEADPEVWDSSLGMLLGIPGANLRLVMIFMLLAITHSVYLLFTVSSMVLCGGISGIRKSMKIKAVPQRPENLNVELTELTLSEKCSCKPSPMKWYSFWCGFRRGELFFLKMFVSELWEWSMQFATFRTLMLTQHVDYLYASLAILLLNVMVSPWCFLFRSKPIVREIIYVVDTVLDLCYFTVAVSFLTNESDLRKEVFVLGFVFS